MILANKSVKTIVKLVILNFIVLAAVSILWFFGIFALVVYSVCAFCCGELLPEDTVSL